MLTDTHQEVVNFVVRSPVPGKSSVFEQGFEKPIAEFSDVGTAEQYAAATGRAQGELES